MPLHRFAGTIRRNKHRDDRAHGRLQNPLAQNDVRAGEPSRRWEARWNKWKGQRNKHGNKKLRAGRGAVGKTTVAGARDRATNTISAAVVEATDARTLQGFVASRAAEGATVYTDDAAAYKGMPFDHEAVNHSVSEYVRDQAHTNGIESFWATLKRGYHGTFHHISPKHLHRYVNEFATRHNMRPKDTEAMMNETVARMVGKRLLYSELVAD